MKSTKNVFKAGAIVIGVVLLGAFALLTANEIPSETLSAQATTSSELLAVNAIDFDGKCGEGKSAEGKKSEKKKGAKKGEKEEESEMKCGEGKCGEGKSSEKKEGKKEEKNESKCGEGKCGGQ